MDSQQVGERDTPSFVRQFDRRLHGCDVAEDLDGNPVGCIATLGEEGFGFDQATGRGVEALDLRRSDRLGPEEEACQSFEADVRRPGLVEVSDRSLGVGDVGGNVAGQGQVPASEGIWQVGVEVAALPIAAGQPLEAGLPSLAEEFGHPSVPIPLTKQRL
jgi:hypothetical protein